MQPLRPFANAHVHLPFQGRLVVTPTKSCPHEMGKVSRRSRDERGTALSSQAILLFPLSFAYAQQNAGWNMVVLQRGCYICAKIYELTLWLEQGRLTHYRS